MGTIIKSLAIEKSAVQREVVPLISETANTCLERAGLGIENIGMLVNTGVYTENHLKEPALASLVQKQLLRKKFQFKKGLKKADNIFSFDIHNGGGGIINAIQVIDGFIQSKEVEHGLIVSGDVKPQTGTTGKYNYTTAAAAILVSNCDSQEGFVKFKTQTFTEFKDDFESIIFWDSGTLKFGTNESDDYLNKTVLCAEKAIRNFIETEDINWEEIDWIITSQSPIGFGFELQKKLRPETKIIQLEKEDEIYSSGLLFSLNEVFQGKKFEKTKNLLLVTVGAGITVSLALYKNA